MRDARGGSPDGGGGAAADDGVVARELIARGVDLARIDQILAGCTLEAGTHGAPRLDIVRADVRALAALDGLGAEAAARIVDLRDSLDETERRGTSWLVSRRALTPEQYGAVAGRITHRSALWRFRIEARIERGEGETGVRSARARSSSAGNAPRDDPRASYAFDCIVDVSTERPRIAFLRDVSLLPTARALAMLAGNAAADEELPKTDSDGGSARAFDGGSDGAGDGGDADDASTATSGIDDDRPARAGSRRSPRPDFDFRPPTARMTDPSAAPSTDAAREPPSRGRVSPTGRDRGGA